MHYQPALSRHLRALTRQYPILRSITLTTVSLTLIWLYAIHYAERVLSKSHIEACDWASWEHWPADAAPHHLVFIADPQLVDPHTYPGRPWPLSTLTERYTDQYMTRNFRLINDKLDPDSVVFLGDLLDGGREWATSRARPLKTSQKKLLKDKGIKQPDSEPQDDGAKVVDDAAEKKVGKRSMDSYRAALAKPHSQPITKKDHNIDERGNDLKEFVHGEEGRWKKWGPKQWDLEYDRFGKIFFDRDQLYPHADRRAFAAWDVPAHPISVENGANDADRPEYAIAGGKTRTMLTGLPGNHDLGFGPGVQLAVRDRHQLHFGDTSRVDVLGNHTFVSIDAPSLAALSQFEMGGTTTPERAAELRYVWQSAYNFIEEIEPAAAKSVSHTLGHLYPEDETRPAWIHAVQPPVENGVAPAAKKSSEEKARQHGQFPVVLLTHVPLYRDPDVDCGKLRERGHALSISGGYQYQNVLTKEMSTTIAQKVSAAGEIVHVFSGDDHDYCEVHHRFNLGVNGKSRLQSVKEITVKSFSWAMGVRKPGFLLVSLWNPVDPNGKTLGTPLPTVQTYLCLLPDQLGVFINYGIFAGVSFFILFVRAVILGLRKAPEEEEENDTLSKLTLPRFEKTPTKQANGSSNGYLTPKRNNTQTKSRQRASSTSINSSPHENTLNIQRSYNARTRSVSPAVGGNGYVLPSSTNYNGVVPAAPLIEQAGYYPQVRWNDPNDESDDEEGRVGDGFHEGEEAYLGDKGKRLRRRAPGRVRRAADEFLRSVVLVGGVAGAVYIVLVRRW